MGLTLHVGARSSGIDRLLTNRWRAGGGLLVARDDHSLGQALDAATADGAVWGCRAGTFATLFGRTRELAGLPDSERRDGLALRCAITEALDPPGAGHVAALERLILELRAARATPEAFTAAAAARGSAALRTAARVYAAVADIPSPDAPEWETVDAAGAVEIGPVYLVGFDDYAPVEWALLCALRARNPIEAGLAYEESRATFAARHDRVAQWMDDANAVDHHDPAEPGDGIGLLERHLFEPQTPATAEGVEWLEAAGTDVSHRMAAERVVTALRAGTPPDQIAVVAPRLLEHLGGLRAAVAEAGVASRHRVRLPFAASPLARALVSLFAFALDEDTPESVDRIVAWLRSPYSGAPVAEVDRFEAAMRRGSPVTRGQLMSRWDGEAMKPAIALRGLRSQPLRSQAAYLVKIGRERLAEAASSPPSATDLLDDAALAVLGGAAGELPEDDRPQGRGDVLPGRLGALLADLGFTEQTGPASAVSLLDLSQARGLRFDHVIVMGLEDGVLPGSPAADPYMPDERLDLLPPRAKGTSEALLRFHAACACATGTLTLMRRFADDDGRELAPSPYWVETRRLLSAAEPTRRGVTGLIPGQAEVISERDLDRRLALEHRPARPAIAAALARRARVRGLTTGLVHEQVRVTALESYQACAYGWFVSSVLNPQPLEQLWDPAAEGTFGHEVLERTFTELEKQCVLELLLELGGREPRPADGLLTQPVLEPDPQAVDKSLERDPGIGRAYWNSKGVRGWEGPMNWIAGELPACELPDPGETCLVPVGDAFVSVRSVVPSEAEVGVVEGPPPLVLDGPTPVVSATVPLFDPLRGLRVSYSALELHTACSLRYHLQVELGLAATDTVIATPGALSTGARAFGERFHEAIERVDWRAPVLAWDDPHAQTLFAVIRDSPLSARLAAATEIHCERPFLVRVDGAIVEGVADIWALEPDGTVLIADWKTGTLHGPDDPGYALQQAIYALAVLRAGAMRVETAWCHVAHEGAVVVGRYGAGDVEELERRVRLVLGQLAWGRVPVVGRRALVCSRCPGLRMGCPIGHMTAA